MPMKPPHEDEKNPAIGGTDSVVLEGFDALIFRRSGRGVSVGLLGARYSKPPRCCDVVDASLDWLSRQPRERIGVDMSLDSPDEEAGVRHILAFMRAMEDSYWRIGQPASSVAVPGLGEWIFKSESI